MSKPLPENKLLARRYLRTRERSWARELAQRLAAAGFRPNAVSAASVVFAAMAGYALYLAGSTRFVVPSLITAAVGIQARLLCNMLDGLLAVEENLKSPLGDVFNELPDRIADALILVGAGYSVATINHGIELGWLAALLAVMTAYIRVLAGSLGATQHFSGPMAKQHRMFVVTLGCLAAAIEYAYAMTTRAMFAALLLVVVGASLTAIHRTVVLARELKQ